MPDEPAGRSADSRSIQPGATQLDAAIVGGGIAGVWLLNLLHRNGYSVQLFEADTIGGEQTLGSQGMIHGGLKYALSGSLTGASEAIAGMPARWRDCMVGCGEVDLTGLAPLSERYYMFAEGNSLGRLTSFFASRVLRGRIERLAVPDYPAALSNFDGVVYALNDFVLDTPSLLARLLQPVAEQVFRHRVDAEELTRTSDGWQITAGGNDVKARRLIITAGAGTGALLDGLGLTEPVMQLRGLQQVLVRHRDLQPLYAHCLTGIARAEPRLTITSHPDPDNPGGWLWYLGGQLASDGVERTTAAQIDHARAELSRCAPWIDWREAEFSCLRWQRAEPGQRGGRRPDQAFVAATDNCLICWPTKLSLAPDLGDRVLAALNIPPSGDRPNELALPGAPIGHPPWTI